LYGFGGLAIPQRDVNGVVPRVLVALAGPVAGFCLAGLTAAAVTLTGGRIWFGWYMSRREMPRRATAPATNTEAMSDFRRPS